ncbi:MAG: efflux RND transporter periplasmic adaptor subunit [Nitrospirae bacterium]|nr:efflux RND transporter periplasmic adaptor subunit [Nitrospirota bacterium]
MKRDNVILFMTFCAMFLSLILFVASCAQNSEGVTVAASGATVIGSGEIQLSPKMASTLQVETVELQPEKGEVVLPGKIQYDDDRYSKVSSPVVGRVVEVRAKLGDRVAAGDPLLVIESPEIGSAYADFIKANSDLTLARHSVELAQDLFSGKAISRKDLHQAENDFQKAEAEFVRTKERLLNLHVPDKDLEEPVDRQPIRSTVFLRSPIQGTVVERSAILGQTVGNDPAQNLFTVADLSRVIAVADLSEKDLTRVALGQTAKITTESYPNRTFSGRVTYTSDLVDPVTRTLKLRCQIENPNGLLKPEMFARVSLLAKRDGPSLPTVPVSSLLRDGDQYVLFVRTGPNRYSRRVVLPQTISGPVAAIGQGIQAGDEVVVAGGILFQNLLNDSN